MIYFSTGWRVNEGVPQNVLQLGTLYRCQTGWCAEVEEFDGNRNIDRQTLPFRHHMRAPYRSSSCNDGLLTVIHGNRTTIHDAIVNELGATLTVQAGPYTYVWQRDNSPSDGFVLMSGQRTESKANFAQPVGFAYKSDDATFTSFDQLQFYAAYDGNIAHKNMLKRVQDEWETSNSSLMFNRFTKEQGSPVYGYTTKGLESVNMKYGKEMYAQNSILPPIDNGQRLRYFLHEYGHDFNRNGCFDDLGHNKMMLPVLQQGLVVAFVYVEYTYDPKDSIPMLSVGRYQRRK